MYRSCWFLDYYNVHTVANFIMSSGLKSRELVNMKNTSSLDAARPDADFWESVFRRIGHKLSDPVCVRDILDKQERERVLLGQVDLGNRAHFLQISFSVHRVWCIGSTVRHTPRADGLPRNETHALMEWESARTLRGIVDDPLHGKRDTVPCISRRTILPQHMLDAGTHPVEPKNIRHVLERRGYGIGDTIDLDGLDAVGMLRVFDHLMRHDAAPWDALAMRRAFRHAIEMRDRVRACFSRSLELWDGEPIRELGS